MLAVFCITKHTTLWPSDLTSKYCPITNETIGPQKDLYMSVHGSFMYNSQNWKQPRCPSTEEYISALECSFNATLLSKEKEHITKTCDDMDKFQICYSECSKPYITVCVLYNYSYEILEQTNPIHSGGKIRTVVSSCGIEVRMGRGKGGASWWWWHLGKVWGHTCMRLIKLMEGT